MSMLSSTITLHDEKTKVLKKKYSTSLIKIYFFTNHCLSPNPGDKGRCWPRTNFSPNQGNKGKKKLTFQRFFRTQKGVKMDGLQYDHIAEEIYRNVGKNDIETRQLLAVKRDILNRLNQSVSIFSTTYGDIVYAFCLKVPETAFFYPFQSFQYKFRFQRHS